MMLWKTITYSFLVCVALSIAATVYERESLDRTAANGNSRMDRAPPSAAGPERAATPAEGRIEEVYYVEFRARLNFFPGGHTMVTYGRLNPDGTEASSQFVAVFPEGGITGFLVGVVIRVPGTVDPVWGDGMLPTTASYRRRISAMQFNRLLEFVANARTTQQSWNFFTHNCNTFASKLAHHIGLKAPKFPAMPAEMFVSMMYLMNEYLTVADQRG